MLRAPKLKEDAANYAAAPAAKPSATRSSLINTWRAFARDRVRLKVSVAWDSPSNPVKDSRRLLCVQVVNLGFMPVTVKQIGFDLERPSKKYFAFMPLDEIGDKLPKKLQPRAGLTIYVPEEVSSDEEFAPVTKAFARTACGCYFRATSSALKKHVESLRKAHPDWRKKFLTG